MLNRRLNEYIFYGSLVLIALVVFLIRSVTLGSLNDQIDSLTAENISLQTQIDQLEELVQENRNVQTSHLYELYDIIPNVYSGQLLTYKTVSMLESLGVDESDDIQRVVFVNQNVGYLEGTEFDLIQADYFVVEVQVSFTTTDADVINEFIDMLYNSDQLFIIRSLNYTIPTSEDFVEMHINFIAIYDVEVELETEES